jgi:hypothetical protein
MAGGFRLWGMSVDVVVARRRFLMIAAGAAAALLGGCLSTTSDNARSAGATSGGAASDRGAQPAAFNRLHSNAPRMTAGDPLTRAPPDS